MLPVSLPRLLLAASSGRAAQPQPPGVHLPAGVVTWAAAYGGSAVDYIHTVEATADGGGFVLAGFTYSCGAGSADAIAAVTPAMDTAATTSRRDAVFMLPSSGGVQLG